MDVTSKIPQKIEGSCVFRSDNSKSILLGEKAAYHDIKSKPYSAW